MTPATTEVKTCPSGFQTFNGSSYCFCWNKQSWRTAQSDCKGLGSELVKITSNAENDFIGNKIVDQHHCWIGLNDIDTENSFKWSVDNSSIQDNGNYSSWAGSQPDNDSGQDCYVCKIPAS
ncbi:CD209 antigen-like protein E isoform X2 [Macrobrachium nipponense]|uniref:CD209 antigen-like protein E isoform X2 n=1 Tax=Macrobrachium nipponense TaxID=159736 RepID=UPI0030C7D389